MKKYQNLNIIQRLTNAIKDTSLVTKNGKLIKQEVADDLVQLNYPLINKIETNDPALIDKQNALISIQQLVKALRSSSYRHSWTDYGNTISLATKQENRNVLLQNTNHVVLYYPYKDTVLVGDENENQKKVNEYMLNDIIDKPAIKDLFKPKILYNVKRFDKNNLKGTSTTSFDPSRDSLFINGNNLIALYSLLNIYQGKVKSIIIDPPYYFNKPKSRDDFNYNSNFHLSTWLTFMKNRLEIAKKFLRDDGILIMTMGTDGAAYLKVLADEVFEVHKHPDNYIGTISWREDKNQSNVGGGISNVTDQILLYRKNKNAKLARIPLTKKAKKEYSYKDSYGRFRRATIKDKTRGKHQYCIHTPNGHVLHGPWIKTKQEFIEMKKHKKIYWPKKGNQIPYGKIYLNDVLPKGQIANDFWGIEFGTTNDGTNEIKKLFNGKKVFSTAKPEKLAKALIMLSTGTGDSGANQIVMDFFAGSATTQAVAMKMNRRFIGVEQMDSTCKKVAIPRLQKVLSAKYNVGVHNDHGHEGTFVYATLMPRNLTILQKINDNMNNSSVLDNIHKELLNPDNDIRLDKRILEPKNIHKYSQLSNSHDKAYFLSSMLDKSGLYYNYCDISDRDILNKLNPKDVKFNKSFYRGEK